MKKKIKLPMINAHTHAAMIGFRGLAEDLPLNKWLKNYIWPAERKSVSPFFVYKNTKKAIGEMKRNGIYAFCDMYFFEEEVARAAKEMKMKAVIGEAILDFPTASAKNPLEAMAKTEELILKYGRDPYIKVAVAPHSIYALSLVYLKKAKSLAKKYRVPYHIHLAETSSEVFECQKKHKMSPVEYMDKHKLLDDKTILAHCVWLTDKDIEIIAKRKTKVVHCPLSNLKLGSGIAPIDKMIKKGITVALGTDGAASSNRLDIWEAAKIAALMQKGINFDPATLAGPQIFKMISLNGIKALSIDAPEIKNIEGYSKNWKKEDFSSLYNLQAGDIIFQI